MASGLQCPGCGHVHPSGLPEIARGDATFRCYGCYRTLSIPEGWTGQPSRRPQGEPPGRPGDAAPGAGTRDARSARLATRRPRSRGLQPPAGSDEATRMVPISDADAPAAAPSAPEWDAVGAARAAQTSDWSAAGTAPDWGRTEADAAGVSPAPNWPAAGAAGGWAGAAGSASPGSAGVTSAGAAGGAAGAPAASRGTGATSAGAPLGWVAQRRSGRGVRTPVRALVWTVAFGVGLLVTAFVLRTIGLLGVNTAIDLYAGSGPRRFAILLVLLPVWALLSATIAHFSIEALARRAGTSSS